MYNISDINKKRFLREKIISGARAHANYLKGKTFLVITDDFQCCYIEYPIKRFKHLSGIKSTLNNEDFYNSCLNATIAYSQIENTQKYNFKTLKNKVTNLSQIDKVLYSDTKNTLFLKELHTNTCDYPVAILNDNMNVCIGFTGTPLKSSTLRTSKNSKNADDIKTIKCIFAKRKNDTTFNEIVYISDVKGIINNVPGIKRLLDDNINERLSFIV